MTSVRAPGHLLVRARGEDSPLHLPADDADADRFIRPVPLDDPRLGLTDPLAGRLSAWARARPGAGASRQNLRRHAKLGLEVAQALARYLGPQWEVRYWDDAYDTDKFVCWGCRRLHWSLDEHDTPPYPLRLRGRDLAARVAREAGPARTVTYGGRA
ncbi:hypothetical protein [Streptomyces sp. NRRL B-24085]|uniref:hypothetical protein n=1 Tax=Streptomyces sp. NRRL B-24085 TaxID=1709476 RepID=UPI0006B31A2D|nr:hypothetical protein [Streptomyces sp. NRRL B-24085]